MQTLKLIQPDDWHIHLRDGDKLERTVFDAQKQFGRAIVMPNLKPPVTTVTDALAYRQRIVQALPEDSLFQPLMTLYLTEQTSVSDVSESVNSEYVHAFKLYPAGATTHSAAGVHDLKNCYDVFAQMEKQKLPLLIHGEVTTDTVDIFDREAVFIDKILEPLTQDFPELKIVLEHVSTAIAVDYILSKPNNIAATITAHHLLLNRNDLLVAGIKPHYYCLPILKKASDQHALLKAATSGNTKFFLGTDSAPHSQQTKETACGCAGIYTAHTAIELYAMAFEKMQALDKLEAFASIHGANFYGLPQNKKTITLEKKPQTIPPKLNIGADKLIPLFAGQTLSWTLA